MPDAALELYLRRLPDGGLVADMTVALDDSAAAPSPLARDVPVALEQGLLKESALDIHAYGSALTAQLFADQRLREAWKRVRAAQQRDGGALRIQLRLGQSADDLHAVRWESLREVRDDTPLALEERVRLTRTLDHASLAPVRLAPRPALRALLIVASPKDLAAFSLPPVDVVGEVDRTQAALGDIPVDVVGGSASRATLATITEALRAAPALVSLICHGRTVEGALHLCLEREDGSSDWVAAAEFVAALNRLAVLRPLLVILASCHSGGDGYGPGLQALGPMLLRADVPAVIAFQGKVALATVERMMPVLFRELRRDGQIDRALAAARQTLGVDGEWWQALLWSRLTRGRLWGEGAQPQLTPMMAPPPPADFVARPEELGALRAALLKDADQQVRAVAITAALRGAGGFGKTTLARVVCGDPQIRAAFPDGILWITLIEHPGDLTGRVQDLVVALSGERPAFATCEAAGARLAELLEPRRCLIVVDDVWNAAHLEPFLAGGPRCVRLITTRHHDTLPRGARSVRVDAMRPAEAMALLAAGLPALPPEAVGVLASRLGEWPVLLRLVNRALHEQIGLGRSADAALAYVEQGLAEEGLTAFDVANPQARDQAVAATIGVSLAFLDTDERERYAELAIFPEEAAIPIGTLARLWARTGGLSPFQARRLCSKLARLSLLQDYDAGTEVVYLHDVMRSYLERAHQTGLHAAHAALLAAHQPGSGHWADLPADEAYLWDTLCYHLVALGEGRAFRDLLVDPRWLAAKLAARGVLRLMADYDGFDHDASLCVIRDALRVASHILDHDPHQLAPQLHGRLFDSPSPDAQHLCAAIEQALPRPGLLPLTASLASPYGPRYRVLTGHEQSVLTVAALPDNQHAITGSSDHTLIVWDLVRGTILEQLRGHTGSVYAVAVTTDGQTAISGSGDGTVRVWDLVTRAQRHVVNGLNERVGLPQTIAVMPDGRRALVGYSRIGGQKICPLIFWNITTGRRLQMLCGHTASVTRVTITRDGRTAVSGDESGMIIVWNLQRAQPRRFVGLHQAEVGAVALLPDQHHVLSADQDGHVHLWDLRSGKLRRSLASADTYVRALSVSTDGTTATGVTIGGEVVQWDLATGQVIMRLQTGSSIAWHAAVTQDQQWLLIASGDEVLVWHYRHGDSSRARPDTHEGHITAVAIPPDGSQFITAGLDRTVARWRRTDGALLHRFQLSTSWPNTLAVTLDGQHVITGTNNGSIQVWGRDGELLHSWQAHEGQIRALALTPDGQTLYSAAEDRVVVGWELSTGARRATLREHQEEVHALAISADGRWLATGAGRLIEATVDDNAPTFFREIAQQYRSKDNRILLWDLVDQSLKATLSGHGRRVTALAFTPDNTRLLSTSADTTVCVWELASTQPLMTLRGHTDVVSTLVILPDGHTVITGSWDHTVRRWNLETGELEATFTDDAAIYACAAAPDGRVIVAGGKSRIPHLLAIT